MHPIIVAGLLAATPAAPSAARVAQRPPEAREGPASTGEVPSAPAAPAAPPSGAAPGGSDEADRARLEEEMARELGASPPAQPAPAVPSPAGGQPAAASGQAGGNPLARLLVLPDISAIGDFAGVYDSLDVGQVSPRSGPYAEAHRVTPLFQELELGLRSVVDPYARADIFISFAPEGVDVEEAYLTTLSLPAGLQVRAGKFLTPFGRLNQQHPHVWDFVDAPLAMDRLLSVDQLKGPGVDVAWLLPVSWYAELHLSGQTAQPGFETASRRMVAARLQQFFDVGEGTALGVGVSAATIERPEPGAGEQLGGADVYLKVRPIAGRSYVSLQAELFGRRLAGVEAAGTSLGGYVQAVYRDGPFFAYGLRGELAPATTGADPGAFSGTEPRVSLLAAWLPSEFQRLRAQLAWDRLPGGTNGFEGTVQLEFVIGAHGAHAF